MITNVSQSIIDMFDAPSRSFKGRVEIYEGSTLARLCGCHDNLKSFTVARTGERGKFFGFGVSQKLTVNLIDYERDLNITKDNYIEVELGVGVDYVYPYPRFFVDNISRDETTNEITIEAYDALNAAAAHTVEELNLPDSYTLKGVAVACATLLGLPLGPVDDERFELYYPNGANLEGTETIREVLNAIADATQTIYFIDSNWNLCFKRIVDDEYCLITQEQYFELQMEEPRVLASIVETNDLGDGLSVVADGVEGETQYIRNNPFLELREDRASLIAQAITVMGGRTIIPFNCSWRGNFLLEIGDAIGLEQKNYSNAITYVLDDSLTFNGHRKICLV